MNSKRVLRPFDVFEPRCPSRAAFDRIFSRWGILVLVRLSEGELRFGNLRRAVGGISEKMLAQTLKALEEEALVERREWDEKPPRVEYRLTKAGQKLSKSLEGVIRELYAEVGKRA